MLRCCDFSDTLLLRDETISRQDRNSRSIHEAPVPIREPSKSLSTSGQPNLQKEVRVNELRGREINPSKVYILSETTRFWTQVRLLAEMRSLDCHNFNSPWPLWAGFTLRIINLYFVTLCFAVYNVCILLDAVSSGRHRHKLRVTSLNCSMSEMSKGQEDDS